MLLDDLEDTAYHGIAYELRTLTVSRKGYLSFGKALGVTWPYENFLDYLNAAHSVLEDLEACVSLSVVNSLSNLMPRLQP